MVTLKEIGKNNQSTQEALATIEDDKREMLLLASLIHPNLPRIYDYFVENNRWYFVMDFLAGETLEAYLNKRKYRPLPVEEVLDCGLQLSAVLDYLHTHKSPLDLNDLTLRNIWRTPDGRLYLFDTGTTSSTAICQRVAPSIAWARYSGSYRQGRHLHVPACILLFQNCGGVPGTLSPGRSRH